MTSTDKLESEHCLKKKKSAISKTVTKMRIWLFKPICESSAVRRHSLGHSHPTAQFHSQLQPPANTLGECGSLSPTPGAYDWFWAPGIVLTQR